MRIVCVAHYCEKPLPPSKVTSTIGAEQHGLRNPIEREEYLLKEREDLSAFHTSP